MLDRIQAIGPARMTRDENQLAVLSAVLTPLQEILDLRRLAVFVDSEEAHVQIETRIFEVVRITAKEGNAEYPQGELRLGENDREEAKAASPLSWRALKLSELVSTHGTGRGYPGTFKARPDALDEGGLLRGGADFADLGVYSAPVSCQVTPAGPAP